MTNIKSRSKTTNKKNEEQVPISHLRDPEPAKDLCFHKILRFITFHSE